MQATDVSHKTTRCVAPLGQVIIPPQSKGVIKGVLGQAFEPERIAIASFGLVSLSVVGLITGSGDGTCEYRLPSPIVLASIVDVAHLTAQEQQSGVTLTPNCLTLHISLTSLTPTKRRRALWKGLAEAGLQ